MSKLMKQFPLNGFFPLIWSICYILKFLFNMHLQMPQRVHLLIFLKLQIYLAKYMNTEIVYLLQLLIERKKSSVERIN